MSFEIRRGKRVGIIGRVASLLEVGTGFHPELTRREILSKFDESVELAAWLAGNG